MRIVTAREAKALAARGAVSRVAVSVSLVAMGNHPTVWEWGGAGNPPVQAFASSNIHDSEKVKVYD